MFIFTQNINMEKVCFRCEIKKDISKFHENKRNKDGHKGTCKSCCRLYIDEHIEEKRQYEREHKGKYKPIRNRSAKKYRDNNKDLMVQKRKSIKYRETRSKWIEKNKEDIRKKKRIYYETHKNKWKKDPIERRKREGLLSEL